MTLLNIELLSINTHTQQQPCPTVPPGLGHTPLGVCVFPWANRTGQGKGRKRRQRKNGKTHKVGKKGRRLRRHVKRSVREKRHERSSSSQKETRESGVN